MSGNTLDSRHNPPAAAALLRTTYTIDFGDGLAYARNSNVGKYAYTISAPDLDARHGLCSAVFADIRPGPIFDATSAHLVARKYIERTIRRAATLCPIHRFATNAGARLLLSVSALMHTLSFDASHRPSVADTYIAIEMIVCALDSRFIDGIRKRWPLDKMVGLSTALLVVPRTAGRQDGGTSTALPRRHTLATLAALATLATPATPATLAAPATLATLATPATPATPSVRCAVESKF